MIYRNPWRKWTVEVSDDPDLAGDHYEAFWRGATRLDRPCELFTLVSDQNPDDAIVQLLLFEDGSLQSWTWQPAVVQADPRRLHVVIGMLKAATSKPHDHAG
ncbi:MAG: hypothetical protein IT431_15575 [Phycisphaerales bacterium]|nr:hypothetical protein [Phycisphaerales bacterium]